jgi:hypothetical protein
MLNLAIQPVSDCLTPKMKALRFHETSVTVYQSTWHNIPGDLNVYKSNSLEFLSKANTDKLTALCAACDMNPGFCHVRRETENRRSHTFMSYCVELHGRKDTFVRANKFFIFNGTHKFITVLTRDHLWTPFWVTWIQSTSSYNICPGSKLVPEYNTFDPWIFQAVPYASIFITNYEGISHVSMGAISLTHVIHLSWQV